MKLGIALGGGGAKGFAHIGVLEAFKEAGVKFDVVTGVSIGSMVGAAYASGTLEDLKKEALSIGLSDLPRLMSPSFPLSGLFSGKNAIEMLEDIVGYELIEELPIKFGTVSANLEKGELVESTSGKISTAVRASIAIPGLFQPVVHEDKVLVDGGTVEPVPVALAKKLGADLVVAVDLFSNLEDEPEVASQGESGGGKSLLSSLSNAIDYFKSAEWLNSGSPHMIDILQKSLSATQSRLTELSLLANPAEIIIAPPLKNLNVLDFHKGEPAIEIGRIAALEPLKALSEKLKK